MLDQKFYISELVGMIGFHMDIIYFEWIELSTKFIPYLGFCGGLKYSSPSFPFNPSHNPSLYTLPNGHGWWNLIRKHIKGSNLIRVFLGGNLPLWPSPHWTTPSQHQIPLRIDPPLTTTSWPLHWYKFRSYILYV